MLLVVPFLRIYHNIGRSILGPIIILIVQFLIIYLNIGRAVFKGKIIIILKVQLLEYNSKAYKHSMHT